MNQSEMKDIEKFINDINFVNVQINRVNKSLSLLRSRISNSIQTNKAKILTNVFNYFPTSIQKATMNNAKKFYRNQKNDKDLNNNTKDRWGISATIKICSLNIFVKPLKAVIYLANKPRNIIKNMFSTGISSKNYNNKE